MAETNCELEGQVAIVTGAGVHTGSTISRTLAAAGAAVAINYRNAKEGALESVAEIEQAGGRAIAIQGDVTLEAPFDFSWCLAFLGASSDVGLCLGVFAHAHENDGVDCRVQLAVPAAVEPVPDGQS